MIYTLYGPKRWIIKFTGGVEHVIGDLYPPMILRSRHYLHHRAMRCDVRNENSILYMLMLLAGGSNIYISMYECAPPLDDIRFGIPSITRVARRRCPSNLINTLNNSSWWWWWRTHRTHLCAHQRHTINVGRYYLWFRGGENFRFAHSGSRMWMNEVWSN